MDQDATTQLGFQGTQVRDDGDGPMVISHRQKLFVIRGPDKGLEKEIEGTRITLGTSPRNDMQLTDKTVSRRHCEISVRSDRYFLKDMSSTNGTQVNGTPVIEAFLPPGARIVIGDTEILFEPKKRWERVDGELGHFGDMVGSSPAMKGVFAMLTKVAPSDLSCVIVGETGTGKELAARAMHTESKRDGKPFVIVDCGAVSKSLIESELFGHEKGAFTGADKARVGAFEAANGGTIFLDEIGELPVDLQPKLLRALERMEIKRLGSNTHTEVDVRVVSATHRNLARMIKAGDFREDLYYRLAEVVVKLPPLRERRSDISLIANLVLEGKGKQLSTEAQHVLEQRDWPGNVRELRNVLRRAAAMASSGSIEALDLTGPSDAVSKGSWDLSPQRAPGSSSVPAGDDGKLPTIREARERWVAPMEKDYLVRLIKRFDGDMERASEAAGVHRKSLERLLRQHGLKMSDLK